MRNVITRKNASCVLALLLVTSATAWAQTTTITATNTPASLSVQLPAGCLSAAGETVNFSGTTTRVLWSYKTTKAGLSTGSMSYTLTTTNGIGQTSGATYKAYGSFDFEFANEDSFGDGQYIQLTDLRVWRIGMTGPQLAFHSRQNATITNQGNTLYFPRASVTCK